jgi:hypothetical protein
MNKRDENTPRQAPAKEKTFSNLKIRQMVFECSSRQRIDVFI